MTDLQLHVLSLVEDPDVRCILEHVVHDEAALLKCATSVDEAVAYATGRSIDVAFIEIGTDSGPSLALCHHLVTLCPRVSLHVLVAPERLERGAEALSLGAAGVIVCPPTGDALARVLSQVKAATLRERQVALLETELARERMRLETYDRLVRFARGAAQSDAVRAIVDGVAQLSTAKGVVLYATFGDPESERVRLSAMGSALDLPGTAKPGALSLLLQTRAMRVLPLLGGAGELGILAIDQGPELADREVESLTDLAAAMLSLIDRQDHVDESVRVQPPRHFRTVAERMLTLAQRHHRRASLLAIQLADLNGTTTPEEATREIADVLRNTDAMCGTDDGELLVFLPETSGLGAHACRRRILARLKGDRRARPKGAGGRTASLPTPAEWNVFVGVATFPHDGSLLKRLIRAARARAADDARSAVYALSLEAMSLQDVVDALIARPMLDAGTRSPYPLDVPGSALFALVVRACREALRGGETSVFTTLQPGLGAAAAARQVTSPKVVDASGAAGCETVEAIVIEAEHGAWVCCGRRIGDRFRGVHCADPLLADVLLRRLKVAGAVDAG